MTGGGVDRVTDVDWRSGSMPDCGEREGDRWSGGEIKVGRGQRYGGGLCADCGVASVKEKCQCAFS